MEAKILRSYTVTGTDFPVDYLQFQSDAEFRLAEGLPYLIEVGVGRDEKVFVWRNRKYMTEPMIQEALFYFTLHIFENQEHLHAYMREQRLGDSMRKAKIKIQI